MASEADVNQRTANLNVAKRFKTNAQKQACWKEAERTVINYRFASLTDAFESHRFASKFTVSLRKSIAFEYLKPYRAY